MSTPNLQLSRGLSSVLPMLAVALACCGTPTQQGADVDGPLGTTSTKQALMVAPQGQWAWNDVPGSHCGNGGQTGFAVNLGTSSEVFIYMAGGGLCWDEFTCNASLPGIGPAAMHFMDGFDENTFWNVDWFHTMELFDRTKANNPYKDATFIYIPYCTGDFHMGSTTQWFPQAQRTAYFAGRQNLDLFLNILAPSPVIQNSTRTTLSGTSAGGFGSTMNYEHIRQAFGNKRLDLVADSGPYLYNNALVFTGLGAWNFGAAMPAGCTNCASNMRNIYSYYDTTYPDSRFAFLSTDQDITISIAYVQLWYPQFYFSMMDFASTTIQPLLHTRFFIPDSTEHGVLDKGFARVAQPRRCDPGFLGLCNPVSNGSPTQLGSWLNDMKTDSASWSNVTGMIMAQCTPNCSGNQCGPDGCGGVCGNCGTDMACTSSNQCLYKKGCTINGVNYDAGARNPAASCQVCDPATPFAWSVVADSCFVDGQCRTQGDRDALGCSACQPSASKTSWTKQYSCTKLVIATTNGRSDGGFINGIAGADNWCANEGAALNLPGTWKAMLGAANNHTYKDTVSSGDASKAVVNLKGEQMYPSWTSIFTNQVWPAGLSMYQFGTAATPAGSAYADIVWTGATANGLGTVDCASWSSTGWYNPWWNWGYGRYGNFSQRQLVDSGANFECGSDWNNGGRSRPIACVLTPPVYAVSGVRPVTAM